jgi:hypothetical protein
MPIRSAGLDARPTLALKSPITSTASQEISHHQHSFPTDNVDI